MKKRSLFPLCPQEPGYEAVNFPVCGISLIIMLTPWRLPAHAAGALPRQRHINIANVSAGRYERCLGPAKDFGCQIWHAPQTLPPLRCTLLAHVNNVILSPNGWPMPGWQAAPRIMNEACRVRIQNSKGGPPGRPPCKRPPPNKNYPKTPLSQIGFHPFAGQQ